MSRTRTLYKGLWVTLQHRCRDEGEMYPSYWSDHEGIVLLREPRQGYAYSTKQQENGRKNPDSITHHIRNGSIYHSGGYSDFDTYSSLDEAIERCTRYQRSNEEWMNSLREFEREAAQALHFASTGQFTEMQSA